MTVPGNPVSSPQWRWRMAAWTALGVCVVLLLSNVSCRKQTTSVKNATSKKEECGTILRSAIGMAQPLDLGVTTSLEGVVNRLNDWRRTCPDMLKTQATLDPDAKQRLAAAFSKAELDAMYEDSYDVLDARHVRNSLVFVQIAHVMTRSRQSDLDQVVGLFDYVVRAVQLVERKPGSAPRPVFRLMLFGRGTAADRAWLFASLLRQLRINAVVISPAKKSADKNPPFVVGVLLNGTIYLFDTQLGLPIPAPDDDRSQAMIHKPATLAQFIADPKIAKSLSVRGFQYPLSADDLKSPRVQLIGHRSLWSLRMSPLYGQVRSEPTTRDSNDAKKAELFEQLGGKQGLIERVVEFGKGIVTRDAISIWPYPQQQITAFANMNAAQRAETAELERPFDAPRDVVIDKKTERAAVDPKTGLALLGKQSRLQLKARIRQLMGDYDKATTSYVSMRSQSRTTLRQHREGQVQLALSEVQMLARAEHDAEFWIGVCKFELNELDIAVPLFRQMENSSKWAHQATYLLALSAVKQNNFPLARTELDALIQRKAPQAHGCAILLQRWQALDKQPAKPKPKSDKQPKKTSPKAAAG